MQHRVLFRKLIHRGDVIFDVGAFQGVYASMLAKITGPGGAVYSFEPHPQIYPVLEQAAATCPQQNIFPRCAAVSDAIGTTELFFSDLSTAKEASTICHTLATTERFGAGMQQATVNTVTLDAFARELGTLPQIVKIDVEGAEELVVAGMAEIIEQCHPVIVFECGVPGDQALPPHFAALRKAGYRLWVIDLTQFHYDASGTVTGTNTEYPPLNTKLFPFTDDELVAAGPALANILCIHETRLAHFAPLPAEMPLTEAIPRLRIPQPSFLGRLAAILPENIVAVLKKIKRAIT